MAIFGSAFWGPSDAQQNAEGFFPAQGFWNTEQYREALRRAQQYGWNADEWTNWGTDYFQNVANQGVGSIADVRAAGDEIMPGRQPLIDARQGRLNQIGQDFDTTYRGVQDRYGGMGASIGDNFNAVSGDIQGGYGRAGELNRAASGDITNNIRDTYGGARQNVFDTYTGLRRGAYGTFDAESEAARGLYGGLQGRSDDLYADRGAISGETYGGLQDRSVDRYGNLQDRSTAQIAGLQGRSTDRFGNLQDRSNQGFGEIARRTGGMYGGMQGDTARTIAGLEGGNAGAYDEAQGYLDYLNPTGTARAGQVARSFAPQLASTKGRLRAAGIDANSPEAASLLGRVETARSRAMDDSYTDVARDYITRKTGLTLGEEGVNRDLGLTGLQTRLGLGQKEEEIGRGTALGALENYQGLSLGELQNNQGLSQQELANYLGLSERELMNYQGLATEGLMNQQGLAERGLMNNQGLATEGGRTTRQLALDRLSNDQGLTQAQLNQDTSLRLGEGQDFRNEVTRNFNVGSDQELQRMNANVANRNRAFDQTYNWGLGQNELDQQGWNTRAGLAREGNAEDLWAYGFNNIQPWQMGNEWLAQQERVKSGAAGPVLNAGNAAAGHNIASGQLARGFGQDAAGNFDRTIQIESPNAGYGAKAIAAAAGAAIGGAAGGVAGAQLGAGIGGGMVPGGAQAGPGQPGYTGFGGYGQYGQGPGQSGYPVPYTPNPYGGNPYGGNPYGGGQYGGGANQYNPMIFSYQPTAQQPTYWNSPAPPTNYNVVPPNWKLPQQQTRY